MREQEKKRQKFYYLLKAKTKPKIFLKWFEFLYGFRQAHSLTLLITVYGAF